MIRIKMLVFIQKVQMKIHRSIYLVAILLIFTIAQSSQLTFPVQHTFHRSNQRHALTAHKKQKIYHDMRVFKTVHSGQLQHQSVASQSYGLNEMGYFFTLNMTVAGIHYRLNIDTGSSNIFIKGGKAPGNPVIRFYCLQCFNTSPKYTISYLDGSLQTYQQNLKVEFGTHTFNEDILVAYTAPKQFEEAEGLVGLSFPQNTINGNSSFLQALKRNKIIDRYAFGVNLNFQQHGRSKISFGAPDPNLYEGTLKKYSIDFGLAYYIIGSGFSFAGQKKHYLPAAIFDTGNTCISIPNKYQSVILNAFNKGGNVCGFMIETSSPQFSLLRCRIRDFNALPVLTVYVKEDAYEVDKQAYMHSIYQSDDGYITDTYIQSVSNQAEIFFGDGFFNRYYTYFDLEQKEIGIAKNREVLSYENTFADSSQLDDEDRAFFNQLK